MVATTKSNVAVEANAEVRHDGRVLMPKMTQYRVSALAARMQLEQFPH
jgi:hypothetical protein